MVVGDFDHYLINDQEITPRLIEFQVTGTTKACVDESHQESC